MPQAFKRTGPRAGDRGLRRARSPSTRCWPACTTSPPATPAASSRASTARSWSSGPASGSTSSSIVDDLKNKQRDEIRALLVEHSRRNNEQANKLAAEAQQRVEQLFADERSATATLGAVTGDNGKLDDLTDLAQATRCNANCHQRRAGRARPRSSSNASVSQVVEDHFRPEMRRMERPLLLQILDTAWKEHLLAMDHLQLQRRPARLRPGRSQGRVQARRHAAVRDDVGSVGNYVTDLIFRMEQLDESFVGSTWVEGGRDQGRRPPGERDRPATAGRHRRHRGRQEDRADPQPRATKSAATTPAPAAAARNTKNCCMRKAAVMLSTEHANRLQQLN